MSGWNHRKSERLRVTCFARCRYAADEDRDVVLVNITQEGCCMELGETEVKVGSPVLIRLESGDALTGEVRWMRDGLAGVQFEEILPRPRMEFLRREHSTFLSEVEPSEEPVLRSVC